MERPLFSLGPNFLSTVLLTFKYFEIDPFDAEVGGVKGTFPSVTRPMLCEGKEGVTAK